ncbi:MAG: FAD-binding protein [Chloroflexota bacterium]|nr:MAG: FAD-binding protein [Chloroflexota bacterium]
MAERRALAERLIEIVGAESVLWDDYDLMIYEYDASVDQAAPDAVALPSSAEQVAAIVRLCIRESVPYVARGAGTGLSGGSIPLDGGVVIGFSKLNRILEIDLENMRAIVEPGVVNLHISNALARDGLYYVPDPSSQKASTIGGNVGENSGGPHTLMYGVTVNHVLGLEIVTPDGEIIHTGGKAVDAPGYDLTGLFCGSEGTMGIVTKVIVKITPVTEEVKTLLGVFETVEDASQTVSDIIASGVIPAALEMMDQLSLQAVEQATRAGYPTDAGAVLLVELEGMREGMEDQIEGIRAICGRNRAREVRVAQSARERQLLWAGRKNAFSAMGRISPDFYVMDGVIPRTRLPEVLRGIKAVSEKYGLRVANVFHAGDGNLHPLCLFDGDIPGQMDLARQIGAEILKICADAGGALTGEHGIGVEKRDLMPLVYREADLDVMRRVKRAWDPRGLCNPGKVIPTPGGCVDVTETRHGRAVLVGW